MWHKVYFIRPFEKCFIDYCFKKPNSLSYKWSFSVLDHGISKFKILLVFAKDLLFTIFLSKLQKVKLSLLKFYFVSNLSIALNEKQWYRKHTGEVCGSAEDGRITLLPTRSLLGRVDLESFDWAEVEKTSWKGSIVQPLQGTNWGSSATASKFYFFNC